MATAALPELKARLSRKLLRAAGRILRLANVPVFPDVFIFVLIPIAVLGYMIAGYYVILAPGNLYNAMVSENWKLFQKGMLHYGIAATTVLVFKVLRGLLKQSASNLLRDRLTRKLHSLYLGDVSFEGGYQASAYYRIALEGKIDNPDQRIATDSGEFASSFFDILAGPYDQATGGVLEAIASVLLYTRSTWVRTGWFGVAVGYAWSLLVGVVSVFVINRTSPVIYKQEELEADFRYGHAQLRRHAEEVAFLRGAPAEHRSLNEQLRRVISNKWSVIVRYLYLNSIEYGFGYYISFVMYATLALAIQGDVFDFSNGLSAGEKAKWISQSGSIFIQLLYSFTMMINLATPLSAFVANVGRLSSLLEDLHEGHSSSTGHHGSQSSVVMLPDTEPLIQDSDQRSSDSDDDEPQHQHQHLVLHEDREHIAAEGLYIVPSEGRRVGPVSFGLQAGQSLLIRGETGSGKTSVLRVLRGLWEPAGGVARVPRDELAVAFVPQRPYISPGETRLRDVLAYPRIATGGYAETERMHVALMAVGWRRRKRGRARGNNGDVGVHNSSSSSSSISPTSTGGNNNSRNVTREGDDGQDAVLFGHGGSQNGADDLDDDLDVLANWATQLSPGEMQLLGACRVIVARPMFAILDEPTAALDVESEQRVLKAIQSAGVSMITVGHSATLPDLHDNVLHIGKQD